jgi:hypothetical protein
MKHCEICEVREDTGEADNRQNPHNRFITIKGRIFCRSCILLGMEALRHWHGTLEEDDSDVIQIGEHTFREAHVIMGLDTLKADMEAFMRSMPKDD